MSYDRKCYELADDFLDDYPEIKSPQNLDGLAQEIQDAIENFIEGKTSE